jgi:hypothetical protein
MYYEIAVKQQELIELRQNSEEVLPGFWVSRLPSYDEAIGYEINGDLLIVKYEETEDGRITFGDQSFNLKAVSQILGLACAMHKKSHFKMGVSMHRIHATVNHPDGAYVAENTGRVNEPVVYHQSEGLVFTKEKNFWVAVEPALIAQLFIDRMGLSIRSLIHEMYQVRFEVDGKFVYYPLANVYHSDFIRESLTRKEHKGKLDWAGKQAEIENFVEEWTK